MAAEGQPTTQEGDAREQLYQKISHGNWRAAVFALAAEVKPGDEWNIEIPGDGVVAMGAMRWRGDDALPKRHPINAHIKKAPDNGTQKEKYDRPEMEWHGSPIPRIEHGSKHDSVESPTVSYP